jgi:hypothetical protein
MRNDTIDALEAIKVKIKGSGRRRPLYTSEGHARDERGLEVALGCGLLLKRGYERLSDKGFE